MMQSLLNRMTTVRADDPDVRRRAQTALQIALTMALISLMFIPLTWLVPDAQAGFVTLLFAAGCFGGAYLLARRGRAAAAAWLIISVFMLATLGSILANTRDQQLITGFFLAVGVVIAGLTLRPWQVWMVVAANLVGLALVLNLVRPGIFQEATSVTPVVGSMSMLVLVGGIAFLGARISRRVIDEVQQARGLAEQAERALAETNASLEMHVAERTAELRQTLAAQQALAEELQSSLATQRELSQVIAELSLPIIPVRDGTVVVPLSGNIDTKRAGILTSSVLEAIERLKLSVIIFDITGVPVVDTRVAQTLLQTASATRLMGAETVLVGIRPEVAQTLVGLGVDLRALRTAATLQEGLVFAPKHARNKTFPKVMNGVY